LPEQQPLRRTAQRAQRLSTRCGPTRAAPLARGTSQGRRLKKRSIPGVLRSRGRLRSLWRLTAAPLAMLAASGATTSASVTSHHKSAPLSFMYLDAVLVLVLGQRTLALDAIEVTTWRYQCLVSACQAGGPLLAADL
jgi:hypothetical protein